jgi:hypothetical protein
MNKLTGESQNKEDGMNMSVETITVNGKTYYSQAPKEDISGDLKIVVLQRGWVLIGRFKQDGDKCTLSNAQVIRRWGTTKGLGELALEGKKKDTLLDPCNGLVEFNALTMVLSISAKESLWAGL